MDKRTDDYVPSHEMNLLETSGRRKKAKYVHKVITFSD